mgnify:CR=1 FL=1
MLLNKDYKFWFCTGSQDLYGEECLAKVARHSKQIVDELNKTGVLPYEIVWKPTLITNELIRKTFNEANNDETCAGVITWMHTFSPAKSWILGLQEYRKPLMHLHTQFNEELPYDTIDMDFMNENQSAHGDREYGHIVSRMRMERKVVVGHWSDPVVVGKIASWMRTAVGIVESSHIRVMRVADNMRNVAVTEGDKVEAQIKFGWEVDAYPVNEIAESVAAVSQSDTNALVDEYYDKYEILLEGRDPEEFKKHVAVQAQIELGFEHFLQEKNYQAIVTHFGDLGALKQLPGLAIQRLMEKGYGFGAEGDWKVAAMVRLMKVMTAGMKDAKGTSMQTSVECETYDMPGYAIDDTSQYRGKENVPYVDSASAWDRENGRLNLFVLNRNEESEYSLTVDVRGFEGYRFVKQFEMYTDDLEASSSFDNPSLVLPKEKEDILFADGRLTTSLKPLSWNVLCFEKEEE